MSLHPAVAFGSAIVGGTLLGAAGTLMALPVAATVQAFVSTYFHRHELVDTKLFAEREPSRPRPRNPALAQQPRPEQLDGPDGPDGLPT